MKRQEKARNNVLKSFSVVIINNFPKYLNATVDVTWCWMYLDNDSVDSKSPPCGARWNN